ncbi:MAG: hypothetical protein D6761_06695 [Candidatus Dadabacteria bacterium]|nr:MAG: hypothetical protein D6761_06695 [Candidatus Dadabacteria bacterium]
MGVQPVLLTRGFRFCTLLAALAVLPACFQSRIDGHLRATGSFSGTWTLRIPGRLANDPQFRDWLSGDGRDIGQQLAERGVEVAYETAPPGTMRLAARDISLLDVPWQSHEFFVRRDDRRFSYVAQITLPTDLDERLNGYAADAVRTAQHAGSKAALAVAQMARVSLDQAWVEIRLTFPGHVTMTNGERADDVVSWRWPVTALTDGRRHLAIAAGELPWYAWWRDRVLDALGVDPSG